MADLTPITSNMYLSSKKTTKTTGNSTLGKDEFLKIYKQDKEKILNKIITTEELIDKYLEKNKKYEKEYSIIF